MPFMAVKLPPNHKFVIFTSQVHVHFTPSFKS